MIKNFLLVSVLAAFALSSCGTKPNYNVKLQTELDTMSYYMGLWTANSMKMSQEGLDDMNVDAFARGMKEAFDTAALPVNEQELSFFLSNYFMNLQSKESQKTLEEGVAFLEENKTKEGVVTLPSGLQYQILTEGTGAKPDTSSTVTIHYVGSLIDGTVFEDSHEVDQPATFQVNGIIPGMRDALLLMNQGSKWKIFIPSEMAYGEQSPPGGPIKPNSALIFEVELLSVE